MRVVQRALTICGETHLAGVPCALIRFAGCPLQCSWCDTSFAREETGQEFSVAELVEWVEGSKMDLVLLTGGEPLLQEDLPQLATTLADRHRVLVETSGALDISVLPTPIIRSVDVKCPDSGQSSCNLWQNLQHLRSGDAVKMVVASRRDYEYAKTVIRTHGLGFGVNILLSSAYPHMSPEQLATWIVQDRLSSVRLNVQLHRIVWPNLETGEVIA